MVSGGCLCGAVRFEVELPSRWCAHCHCSYCRRAHGAGVVTWFGVPAAGFHLRAGDEALRWYQSSPEARRGFCGSCGSPMLFTSERWPEEVHVVLACMEGEIDRSPQVHVFWAEHVPWLTLADELPRLEGSGS